MSVRHKSAEEDLDLAQKLLAEQIQADMMEMHKDDEGSFCPSPSLASQPVPGSSDSAALLDFPAGSPVASPEPAIADAELGSPTIAAEASTGFAMAVQPASPIDDAADSAATGLPTTLTLEEAASPGFAMGTPPECASAPEAAVVATSEALDRSRSPEVRQRPATRAFRRPAAAAVMQRPAAHKADNGLEPGQRDERQHLEDGLWVGCSKCRWTACAQCRLRAQKAARQGQ